MTHPAINPKLVKIAANMAIPIPYNEEGDEWCIDKDGLVFRVILTEPYYVLFNPLHSDSDAWALERALKNAGWEFRRFVHGLGFRAEHDFHESQQDPSDTLLLLKCVSAQTGIPLHAKGVKG